MEGKKQIVQLDFIKGIAAISVVLLHALPKDVLLGSFAYVHIWQAVPLFVFVSFYLFFRKLDAGNNLKEYYSWKNIRKVIRKVVVPFVVVQLIFVIINFLSDGFAGIKWMIGRGGDGRGSYYPYVYCQIWIVAPLLYLLLNRMRNWHGVLRVGVIILLSIICNVLVFSYAVPVRLESCLVVRYLFMSVVAWEWLQHKDSIWWRYILPIVSIVYWIVGLNYDLSPWIPTQGGWGGQQFPSFFYTFFFVFILFILTPRCGKIIRQGFVWAGTYSYYIFLMQMVFFKFLPLERFESFCGSAFSNNALLIVCYVLCALVGSILPISLYDKIKTIRNNQIHITNE